MPGRCLSIICRPGIPAIPRSINTLLECVYELPWVRRAAEPAVDRPRHLATVQRLCACRAS
ncbi:hypothetical protein EMIT0P201_12762 [Pseudomonas chlororaphis]